MKSVRATLLEQTRELPGDDLLGHAIAAATYAVTIDRPPHDVWPWLAQMGVGRAGWYSYDFIDNGGQRSAEELLPDLQAVRVGGLMPGLPGATEGFIVAELDSGRSLVLGWPSDGGAYLSTWSFVLHELAGDRTRLIVRSRVGPGYRFLGLPPLIGGPIARLGHFIMQRKQLIGIRRRAGASEGVAA